MLKRLIPVFHSSESTIETIIDGATLKPTPVPTTVATTVPTTEAPGPQVGWLTIISSPSRSRGHY